MENNFPLALRRGGKQVASPANKLDAVNRPTTLNGRAKLVLSKNLVTRWNDLAIYFEIPMADQATFQRGTRATGDLRLAGATDTFERTAGCVQLPGLGRPDRGTRLPPFITSDAPAGTSGGRGA